MIYFIITVVMTGIHLYFEFHHQKNLIRQELQTVTNAAGKAITTAIWDMNYNQLEAEVNGMMQFPIIKAVEIFDKENATLFERTSPECNGCKEGSYQSEKEISQTLFDSKIYMGKVILYSNLDMVIERVKVNFGFIVFNAFIKSFLLVSLFIFAFRKHLSRPLDNMVSQIDTIDLNNLEKIRIIHESPNKDELVILKNSMNEMLEKLDDQMEEIQHNEMIMYQQNKMAAMGEMVGVIAHQWKQPLNAIHLLMEEAVMDLHEGTLDTHKLQQHKKRIENVTQHLSKTVDDFRNFYRIDREEKLFYPKAIIEKSLEILQYDLKFSQARVYLEVDPELTCRGFPNEFSHVILNLVKNAIDVFKERKAIKDRVILISSHKILQDVQIRIHDSAGGIPSELETKIFERFFTTKDESSGTGLGLYMSKKIIENRFGGKLLVQNSPFTYEDQEYYGACFMIQL